MARSLTTSTSVRPIVVIGAGGHASVVTDALLAGGAHVLGLLDNDQSRHGKLICDLPVLGGDDYLEGRRTDEFVLANGLGGTRNEPTRRHVQQDFESRGWTFATVVHPAAVVSPFAELAAGVQVMARSVVQVGARIGRGSIVNTGAVIEHHSDIGDFVHVAPGAVLCGEVRVGSGSHIGAGAVIRQGVRLGADVLVGAGAVVVADFGGPGQLLGVPARSNDQGR